MEHSKIQNILVKFINNEANITELEVLEKWLTNPKNVTIFNRFIEIDYLAQGNMKEYNIDKAKIEVNKKIKAVKQRKRMLILKKTAIAASVIFAIGLGYTFLNNKSVPSQEVVIEPTAIDNTSAISPGTNKAVLTLGNGNQINLSKNKTYTNNYVTSDGKTLTYSDENTKSTPQETIEFNTLTIPRGGEYFVILPDGSKVWLNSETELKYPTKFIEGKARNIELVYGEIYIEVSPHSLHKGAKFNVTSKGQKVTVLGTEFNIKAYNDESEILTTLVEGRIKLLKDDFDNVLFPNQQAQLNLITNKISIASVDVGKEIAWVKGLFSFEEARLDDMMKTLSRWYNIDIFFMDSSKKEFQFTGILERTSKIEDVLEIIKQTSLENELSFNIKGRVIIIK